MATWEMAGRARNDFADMIEGLSPAQLQQKSLCEEWTAEGVLAHVTSFVETGLGGFVANMVKSRFDFDKASLNMAKTQLARPTSDVLASLRAKATKSAGLPMFPEELTASDTVIHTQDVCRGLGLGTSADPALVRTTLDFLTTHKMATTLVHRKPLGGVKLVATDSDWTFGAGDQITGTGEALMMGLSDRPVLDELSGSGVAKWQ